MVAPRWSQVQVRLNLPVYRLVFTTLYEVLTYLGSSPTHAPCMGERGSILDRFRHLKSTPVSMLDSSTYTHVTGSVSILVTEAPLLN